MAASKARKATSLAGGFIVRGDRSRDRPPRQRPRWRPPRPLRPQCSRTDLGVTCHDQLAAIKIHVDIGYSADSKDLLGHRAHAVLAVHPRDAILTGDGQRHFLLLGTRDGERQLGADQTCNSARRFLDLAIGLGPSFGCSADDAVAQVFLEQTERDRLKRARHRGYLGEDIDAVLLLLDHLLRPRACPSIRRNRLR